MRYNLRMKTKNILLYIAEFVGFFALFFVLFNAGICSIIYPFAFGALFALAWANQKVWLLVPSYIGAGVLFDWSLENAICLLVTVFCLIVPYFAHVLAKKNMRKWEIAIFALVSQISRVVFDILGGQNPIAIVAGVILGMLFMLACVNVLEAVIIRGFTNKLTPLELICLLSCLAVICSGLCVLDILSFSLLKLFMCLMILTFSFCSTPLLTLLVAAVGGIGSLLATGNATLFCPFELWALVALLFKKRYRILSAVGVMAVEALSGWALFLYGAYDIMGFLPVAIASVAFLCLPKKFCEDLSLIFNFSKDRLAMKNVVNRDREILHRRLGNLSEVFDDMNVIYRKMVKSTMTFEDVQSVLEQELMSKICSFCPERNHCHRTHAESTKEVFDELIKIAYDRGKATVLDIPSFLTSRCKQSSAILGSINALTSQYKKYMSMSHDIDTSKILIAEQLQGVSKIMGDLSREVEENVSFDSVRENKILDEMTYNNIICIDAVVFERDVHTVEVSVVVRSEDSERLKIASVVGKVCGCKMSIVDAFPSVRPGFTVVNLRIAPKIDCLFGVSQHTKNGSNISGDTYSVVKLDGQRLLFAISDGMGSGEKAESASELSISLVENFYKAGFDNDLILSTVNKLLNLHKEEIFSALDIMILDEKSALADFIKMGSPKSYILSEDECRTVEAGALPMGIVDEGKPLIKKNVLSAKELVVMVSDGVSDSFGDDEALKNCIKSIKTKNAQEFADELISRALSCNNGYAVDDMTVLVVKTLAV